MPKAFYKFSAVGKRKTAVARIFMNPGSGKMVINERTLEDYFPIRTHQAIIKKPLLTLESDGKYDVKVRVLGGGISGQAEAVAHGLARALLNVDPEHRSALKEEGLLTRDARKKERKKYGQPGARKKFQYSKR